MVFLVFWAVILGFVKAEHVPCQSPQREE